jgi:hypothetical protein
MDVDKYRKIYNNIDGKQMPPASHIFHIDNQPSVETQFLQFALLWPTCPVVAASHPAFTFKLCDWNDHPISTFT